MRFPLREGHGHAELPERQSHTTGRRAPEPTGSWEMLQPLVKFPVCVCVGGVGVGVGWGGDLTLSPRDPEAGRQTADRVEAPSLPDWRWWDHMSAIQEPGFLLCPDPNGEHMNALLMRNVSRDLPGPTPKTQAALISFGLKSIDHVGIDSLGFTL